MTEEEFRADLLATAASRAEVQACGSREAFVIETLEQLQNFRRGAGYRVMWRGPHRSPRPQA